MPLNLDGADSSTRRFLTNLHEDSVGNDDPQGRRTAFNAGVNYLQTNTTDGSFGGLRADRASDYGSAVRDAANAVGAPAGSIAARSDPFRYGSVASREFGDTFTPGATDALDNYADQSPTNTGLARRALTQKLTGG